MGAAAAAQVAVPAAAPKAEAAPKPVASNAMVPHISGSSDLMQMMAAAIEAALQPRRNQLETTIMPLQRTIASLQAEFVALRDFFFCYKTKNTLPPSPFEECPLCAYQNNRPVEIGLGPLPATVKHINEKAPFPTVLKLTKRVTHE